MSTGHGQDIQIALPAGRAAQLAELLGSGHEHDERIRAAATEQAHQGHERGFTLGFDCGLGSRPEFTAGLLAGLEAGNAERRRIARDLLSHMTQARRHNRPADREAGA